MNMEDTNNAPGGDVDGSNRNCNNSSNASSYNSGAAGTKSNNTSEKPHRHHSYNGHNSSKKVHLRDLPKSKSNSRIECKPELIAQVLLEQKKQLSKDLEQKQKFSKKSSELLSNDPMEESQNTILRNKHQDSKVPEGSASSAGGFKMSQSSKDNISEGFENSMKASDSNRKPGSKEVEDVPEDEENKTLKNDRSSGTGTGIVSGYEENKNRYNVLVSQFSTISTVLEANHSEAPPNSSSSEISQLMTAFGNIHQNSGDGKGSSGNNSDSNNGSIPLLSCDNSSNKPHRNSSPASLLGVDTNKQSLKQLSASAPAMRSDLGKNSEKGEFFMAPSSSKSRQKKFHRHFKTVPQEEKVLDYYSCALVGDILLQGFLYISENYFAFYSNVFGYVTKLLIPVCSVVSITKERTAKIFPNAVGVVTQSEKHVFASLISRDTTYKLMYKVWIHTTQQSPTDDLILTPGSDTIFEDGNGTLVIPDESSGESGSGNDSALEPSSCSPSPQSTPGIEKLSIHHHAKIASPIHNNHVINQISHSHSSAQIDEANVLRHRTTDSLGRMSNGSIPGHTYLRHNLRSSIVSSNEANSRTIPQADESAGRSKSKFANLIPIGGSNTPSLLILATALLVILFMSATLLLIRISNLQSTMVEKPGQGMPTNEQFYKDLVSWQKSLHSNSAEEIHQFIDSNLQQIVRVRESLEALSTLFLSGQHNLNPTVSTHSPMGVKDS